MVSIDASQQLLRRSITFKSLAVTDTDGHCIVLLGTPNEVFFEGQIRLR